MSTHGTHTHTRTYVYVRNTNTMCAENGNRFLEIVITSLSLITTATEYYFPRFFVARAGAGMCALRLSTWANALEQSIQSISFDRLRAN